MNRTKIVIMSVGGVSLLLALVLAFLTWNAWSEKNSDEEELEFCNNDMERLTRLPIYPSEKSVKEVDANRDIYATWVDGAKTVVSAGDCFFAETTAPAFKALMVDEARRISETSGAIDGKIVKADFAFGFPQYIVGGEMPKTDDLPRLQREWHDVVLVLDTMISAGVSGITSIEMRKAGDFAAADNAAKGKNAKNAKANQKQNRNKAKNKANDKDAENGPKATCFEIGFNASSAALVKTLNMLTSEIRFVVIDSMTFAREVDEIADRLSGKNKDAEKKNTRKGGRGRNKVEEKPEEEEEVKGGVVADPQAMADFKVTMRISVYDFGTAKEETATVTNDGETEVEK